MMLTELDADLDGEAIVARLGTVLDPELDEPIFKLGFVKLLRVRDRHAQVTLELPTSWCAMNFAFLMAEDVRRVLLGLRGIEQVTVRLGDHSAAAEIEAAVNEGKSFLAAFPGGAGMDLAALRGTFLRKGFLKRQERLLHELRRSGWCPHEISAFRVSDGPGIVGNDVLQMYLERRAELGLDCSPEALLIIDQTGSAIAPEKLDAYYVEIRTVRVSMEANGSFCRALLATRGKAMALATTASRGNVHVQA
jgi:metal-sulfur cluster biosynthetic enzyme